MACKEDAAWAGAVEADALDHEAGARRTVSVAPEDLSKAASRRQISSAPIAFSYLTWYLQAVWPGCLLAPRCGSRNGRVQPVLYGDLTCTPRSITRQAVRRETAERDGTVMAKAWNKG